MAQEHVTKLNIEVKSKDPQDMVALSPQVERGERGMDNPGPPLKPYQCTVAAIQRKQGNAAAQRWVRQNNQQRRPLNDLPPVPGSIIQTTREVSIGNDVRTAQRRILRRFPGLLNAGMPPLSAGFHSQVHAMASDDYDAHLRERGVEDTEGVNGDQIDAAGNQSGGIYLRGDRARTAPHAFNVTLIHEILHALENSGLAAPDMMEGMTQYLAIYVADGHVTQSGLRRAEAYPTETQMIFDLATTLHLSPIQMAQLYFQSNASVLSRAVNEHLHSNAGWGIIQACFHNLSNAPMSNPEFGISANALRQVTTYHQLFNQLLRRIVLIEEHSGRAFIITPAEWGHGHAAP